MLRKIDAPANALATFSRNRMNADELSQPLVFEPIFMERVWGGRRLESIYGKRLPAGTRIGESWEMVDRPEAQSVVHLGPFRGRTLHDLWMEQREEIFGLLADAPRFPILLKFLDAQENLSLQVHPPEALAQKLGGEPKTEFWYVSDAAPGSMIFAGLKKEMTAKAFEKALAKKEVIEHAHVIPVTEGDALFLPSGRLHALGAGNLIVEIQQNSDTTYRVFDWGREGRTMHIAEALQSINFKDRIPSLIQPEGELLVKHSLFEIEKWSLESSRDLEAPRRFVIVVCLAGALECGGLQFKAGDVFLMPAHSKDRVIKPVGENTSILRVVIPPSKIE